MIRATTEGRYWQLAQDHGDILVKREDAETKVWIDRLSMDTLTQWNRDGVWWEDAPIPSRLHRCSDWSRRERDFVSWHARCACGAQRGQTFWGPDAFKAARWRDKNSR